MGQISICVYVCAWQNGKSWMFYLCHVCKYVCVLVWCAHLCKYKKLCSLASEKEKASTCACWDVLFFSAVLLSDQIWDFVNRQWQKVLTDGVVFPAVQSIVLRAFCLSAAFPYSVWASADKYKFWKHSHCNLTLLTFINVMNLGCHQWMRWHLSFSYIL